MDADRSSPASPSAVSETESLEAPAAPRAAREPETRLGRRDVVLLLVITLLALGLRLGYQLHYKTEINADLRRFPDNDANTWDIWARRIAGGDVLSRDMYHPWHWWTREIAPLEDWNAWYGEKTWHQAPVYPYLVALGYTLFGGGEARPTTGPDGHALRVPRGADPTPWLQAVLGALLAGLTYLLARRYLNRIGATAAAALVALNGPLIFFETHMLRESMLAVCSVLMLLVIDSACRRATLRSFAVAGLVIGFCTAAKVNSIVFFPLLAIAPLLHPAFPRSRRRRLLVLVPAGLLATCLALTPLFVRNVIVGARTFSISSRGPEVLVAGNARGSTGIGWFPKESREELLEGEARRILNESKGSLTRTIGLILASYSGDMASFVKLQANKLKAFLSGYEIPNNTHFPAVREGLVELQVLPDFRLLGPLALLGIALVLIGGGVRLFASPLLYLLLYTAMTVGFYIIGRFRIPVVPVFALFAGAAVATLVRYAATHRLRALGLSTAALLAMLTWTFALEERPGEDLPPGSRLYFLADLQEVGGRIDRAVRTIQNGIQRATRVGDTQMKIDGLRSLGAIKFRVENDFTAAENYFRQVIELSDDPGALSTSHSNIAIMTAQKIQVLSNTRQVAPPQEHFKVLEEFEKAISYEDVDDPDKAHWMALAYAGRARYRAWMATGGAGVEPFEERSRDKAIADFEKALEYDPFDGQNHIWLGDILHRKALESASSDGSQQTLQRRANDHIRHGIGLIGDKAEPDQLDLTLVELGSHWLVRFE